MSEDLAGPDDNTSRWLPLWLILAVPLAVGLYLGFTYSQDRTIRFWIELLLGLAMVGAGIGMLIDSRHFAEGRIRMRVAAVVYMVLGLGYMAPRGSVRMTLMSLTLLLILAAWLEIPTRLFRPRPS